MTRVEAKRKLRVIHMKGMAVVATALFVFLAIDRPVNESQGRVLAAEMRQDADLASTVKIVAVGHFYTLETFPDMQDVFVRTMKTRHADADALVFMGDVTRRGTEGSWRKLKERVLNRIATPVFFTPGNHDLRQDRAEKNTAEVWEKYVGYTSKVARIGNCNLYLLNSPNPKAVDFDFKKTVQGGGLDQPSLDLLGAMRNQEGVVNLVFMHHNLEVEGMATGRYDRPHKDREGFLRDGRRHETVWNQRVRPLIAGKADAVISGDFLHFGAELYVELDGIPYYRNAFGRARALSPKEPVSTSLPYTLIEVRQEETVATILHLDVPYKSAWMSPDAK